MSQDDKCFACGRAFRRTSVRAGLRGGPRRETVRTIDGQVVFVGADCHYKIVCAGEAGYQPPLGGPRLFDTATRVPIDDPRCECGHLKAQHFDPLDLYGDSRCTAPACQRPNNPRRCSGYYPTNEVTR